MICVESCGVTHLRVTPHFLFLTQHDVQHLHDIIPVRRGELLDLLGDHGRFDLVAGPDFIAQQHIGSNTQYVWGIGSL